MNFNQEKLESIGSGSEKDIYVDPRNPDRVIARFHKDSSETERSIKGRFYFSKILHILLPKNIPDIHLAAKNGEVILSLERKKLDKKHIRINDERRVLEKKHDEILRKRKLGEEIGSAEYSQYFYYYAPNFKSFYDRQEDKLHSNPRYQEFIYDMNYLGINVDKVVVNFGYDNDGNLIYIDNNFRPWILETDHQSGNQKIKYRFNKDRLLDVIDLLDKDKKELAMEYFNRLEILAKEELESTKNK